MDTAESITTTGALACGSFTIPGTVYGTLARTNLTQDDLKSYPLDLAAFVVHDTPSSKLPAAGAADDLGCVRAAFGTNSITLKTKDCKTLTASSYGTTVFPLPPEYVAGETVQLIVSGKMDTTVASVLATVDVEAHEVAADGTVGADLCTTAAQSINSLTAASRTFSINATGLTAGDQLDIRITVAIQDGATATEVYGVVTKVVVQCDVKG